jgi:hypothetical protein
MHNLFTFPYADYTNLNRQGKVWGKFRGEFQQWVISILFLKKADFYM